jgi:hypothetical protein
MSGHANLEALLNIGGQGVTSGCRAIEEEEEEEEEEER